MDELNPKLYEHVSSLREVKVRFQRILKVDFYKNFLAKVLPD